MSHLQGASGLCLCAICGPLWSFWGSVSYEWTDFCWKGDKCCCCRGDKETAWGDAYPGQGQVIIFVVPHLFVFVSVGCYGHSSNALQHTAEDHQVMEDGDHLIMVKMFLSTSFLLFNIYFCFYIFFLLRFSFELLENLAFLVGTIHCISSAWNWESSVFLASCAPSIFIVHGMLL